MIPFHLRRGMLLFTGLLVPDVARAAPAGEHWFLHLGAARMSTDPALTATALGSPLPGAAVVVRPRYAAAVEVGRYIVPTLSVSVSAGTPVREPIGGAGSIRPYGALGKVTYGPAAFAVQWHPLPHLAFRPYVGGGVAYLHIFDTSAGALRDFRLRDDLGPVVQGGAELMVARHVGLYADARKGWLTSSSTGSLGPVPVNARLRLDPVVLSAGAAFRF